MKKSLFFILCLIIISCNKDDESILDNELLPTIFIEDYYSVTLQYYEIPNLSEGDLITKIEASTNFGELRFGITSQTIQNAFKINAVTGDVLVNNAQNIHRFQGTDITVNIKISNGQVFKNTYLTIYVEQYSATACEESYWELFHEQSEWYTNNSFINQEKQANTIQYTLSVSNDKTLCFFKFPYNWSYNTDTTVQLLLLDEANEILLDKTLTTNYYNDWWEEYYFDTLDLETPLTNNKNYTLKIEFNQSLPFSFKLNPNNLDIQFPIQWGDLVITGTSYINSQGEEQINKALLYLEIGLIGI